MQSMFGQKKENSQYRPLSEHSVPMVLLHVGGQGTYMKLSEKFSEKCQ